MVNRRIVITSPYDWTSIDVFDTDEYGEMEYKPESFEIPVDVLNTVGWYNRFDYPSQTIIPMTPEEVEERNAFRAELEIKRQIEERMKELRAKLQAYSEDAIQVQMGAYIPDWEERRRQFNVLHAELRQLEGKAPRMIGG